MHVPFDMLMPLSHILSLLYLVCIRHYVCIRQKCVHHPQLQTAEEALDKAQRVRGLLAPFVLRRLKGEVAKQLAPKQHVVIEVPMEGRQLALYEATQQRLREEVSRCVWVAGFMRRCIVVSTCCV